MTAEERQKYRINLVIFNHWLKLIYAKLANHFYPFKKLHSFIQSRRLAPVNSAAQANYLLSKIRLFLKLFPRLRYSIRYLRWQIKKLPVIGKLIINLESRFVAGYAEERYCPDSPFSDGTDFTKRSRAVLPLVYGKVLDLGCGYGYLTKLMADKKETKKIIAIDKIKNFRCPHPKIEFISADITQLKKIKGKFDVVVASEFIEHISEPDFKNLLLIIKNSLLPGGFFIGTTPDGIIPSNWPFHIREYSRKELEFLLKNHFNKVEIQYIDFNNIFFKAEGPEF